MTNLLVCSEKQTKSNSTLDHSVYVWKVSIHNPETDGTPWDSHVLACSAQDALRVAQELADLYWDEGMIVTGVHLITAYGVRASPDVVLVRDSDFGAWLDNRPRE